MVATIRLTVLTGAHKGRRFCFCGPAQCLVGRASDCFVNFSGTERDLRISRHHCQLDIEPPLVQLRDLQSSNGTFVNGEKVATEAEASGTVINDGDLVTIAGTTFIVDVVDCPIAESNSDGKPIWGEGRIAKKDCPVSC